MKTVVVGVGNPILGDDGVGIHVVKGLKGKVEADIREAYTGGLNLLDIMIGYERVILVDAVYFDDLTLGEVKVMDLDTIGTAHSSNPHDASLMEAIEMSKKMGEENIPDVIELVGIRIDRVDEFSEELSPVIRSSIPEAMKKIQEILSAYQ